MLHTRLCKLLQRGPGPSSVCGKSGRSKAWIRLCQKHMLNIHQHSICLHFHHDLKFPYLVTQSSRSIHFQPLSHLVEVSRSKKNCLTCNTYRPVSIRTALIWSTYCSGELESPKESPDIWTPISKNFGQCDMPSLSFVEVYIVLVLKFAKLLAGAIFSPVWGELGNDSLEFTNEKVMLFWDSMRPTEPSNSNIHH